MKYRQGDEPIQGYRLVRVLGRGGFGVVWLADGPGGVPSALKIIDLTIGRGRKELRAIQRVKSIVHPNLVPIQGLWLVDHGGRVLDEGERESVESSLKTVAFDKSIDTVMDDESSPDEGPDELVIAMGLCERSLTDRLRECLRDGRTGVPSDELLRYMEDAARAIDYLNTKTHDLGSGHVGGIQHGDIKPSNLMIVGGAVQVCDFGLARVLRDSSKTTIAYTPAYAAPETITLNRPSAATDQYSLAVSYLELRTGKLPFDSDSHYLIAKTHTEGRLDLSALPPGEATVIGRALSVDPGNRYGSASEMVAQLRLAVDRTGAMISAAPPSPTVDEVQTELPTRIGDSDPDAQDHARPDVARPDSRHQPHTAPPTTPSSTRRWLVAVLATLFGGILIGALMWLLDPGPPLPLAAPPTPGMKHDPGELDKQLTSVLRRLDEEASPATVIKDLHRRFSHLQLSWFDDTSDTRLRADLEETQELVGFLLGDPPPTLEQVHEKARSRPEIPGSEPNEPSGLGRNVVYRTLKLVISRFDEFKNANLGQEVAPQGSRDAGDQED